VTSGPGARALHDQRIVAVTPRGEAHHVIGERDICKRVLGVQVRQSHRRLAVGVYAADITQNLLLLLGVFEHGRHVRIELRQACHEFVHAGALQRLRHQPFHLDIRHFERQPHFAAQDDELARDIHAR